MDKISNAYVGFLVKNGMLVIKGVRDEVCKVHMCMD